MNKKLVDMTREFHEKNRFALDQPLPLVLPTEATQRVLNEVAGDLLAAARRLEDMENVGCEDLRVHRVQLLVEELGEVVQGMAVLNEVETLDGLADLAFVTVGSALAFGLPFLPALYEVCKSNMTKATRQDGDPRLRNKGDGFEPPDIAGAIAYHDTDGRWCSKCGMKPADRYGECINCGGQT